MAKWQSVKQGVADSRLCVVLLRMILFFGLVLVQHRKTRQRPDMTDLLLAWT